MRRRFGKTLPWLAKSTGVIALLALAPVLVRGQQASVSTWDAAGFRIWGYIPDWDDNQVSGYPASGKYSHVSDVLFFGAIRADSTGNVTQLYPNTTASLRSQAATYGFKLHFSMMAVTGTQGVTATW